MVLRPPAGLLHLPRRPVVVHKELAQLRAQRAGAACSVRTGAYIPIGLQDKRARRGMPAGISCSCKAPVVCSALRSARALSCAHLDGLRAGDLLQDLAPVEQPACACAGGRA